jgi:protein phosphatase
MLSRTQSIVWASAGDTHPGNLRRINQDALLDRPELGVWAVADGMGGHAAGERASRLLIELLGGLPAPRLLGGTVRSAECLIAEANRRLIAEAESAGADIIGTTVVALIAVGDACALLWVGDSRGYRLRGSVLEQLTVDHTAMHELMAAGSLSAEQARAHPYSSALARAVGAEDEVQVDRVLRPLRDGDRYLLCSDGLTKELDASALTHRLGHGTPEEAVAGLVTEARNAGGRDNITAVVVDFSSTSND